MSKHWITVMIFVFSLVFFATQATCGGDKVDLLIEKLVEKRILTQSEARELLKSVEEESALAVKKKPEPEKGAGPAWVDKIKLKGDLRLRYEHNETDGSADRDRGRFRWRLGAETTMSEQLLLGFGVASGGDDPRSTNQSFDDAFSSKGIVIDHAFATYTPCSGFSLSGGKIHNPVFRAGDLLWDGDIKPEGMAGMISWKPTSDLKLFMTPMFFILEEISGSSSDPYLYGIQPGVKWNFAEGAGLTAALAAYGFSNEEEIAKNHSGGGNTRDGDVLRYDYDSVAIGSKLEFSQVWKLPHVSFFGEYVYNPDPEDDNQGYLVGFTLGHKKIKDLGDWKFSYNYRHLEKDAWPDIFPDSDALGGATGIKGHEGIFVVGLYKYLSLSLDYYRTEETDSPDDKTRNLFQMDLNFKF